MGHMRTLVECELQKRQTPPDFETFDRRLDIMDLPCTERGNKHVVVFQDMFTKWLLVFPVPDQKAERIAKLLCEEVVPLFWCA